METKRCQTTSQGALSSSAGHVSTQEISPCSPQAPSTFAVLFAHLCLSHQSDRVAAVSQGVSTELGFSSQSRLLAASVGQMVTDNHNTDPSRPQRQSPV